MEEKSIIDNLLDEIKNGFPLKKAQVSTPVEKEAPASVEKTESETVAEVVDPKKARRNWRKTKMLASLIGRFEKFL